MKQVTVSVSRKMLSSVLLLLALASISQCCLLVPTAHPTPEMVHQVSVRYYDRHLCTGSLITPSYVLTVATCVLYYDTLWARVEEITVAMHHPTIGILFVSLVKNIIPHENAATNLLHDIALIVLSSPQYPSLMQPFGYAKIPLRDEDENAYVNKSVIVTGFIRTRPNYENDKTVIYGEASVSVLTKQDCIEKFRSLVSYICVDDPCRASTDCKRNLGGALIAEGGQVVGLLSRQKVDQCSHLSYDKLPAGFTPISWYRDWILNQMFNYALEKGTCTPGCAPFIRNL